MHDALALEIEDRTLGNSHLLYFNIARITLPHIIKLRVPIEAVTLWELHISLSRVIMSDFGRDKGCIWALYKALCQKGIHIGR